MHPNRHRFTPFLAVLAAVIVSWVQPALADDVGGVGTLVGLSVNTTLADTYLQYHGRMFVQEADKSVTEYRWGGTSCGTRVLTDAQVAELHSALDSKVMRIQPLSQTGQGDDICVVGFTLAPKKYVGAVIP